MRPRPRLHVKMSRSCNNNCIFCLDDRDLRTDASEAEVMALLEAHAHIGEMLFTCGEPTLHPLLPRSVDLARRAGYRSIGLVTNGRRLSYLQYCSGLVDLGLNEVTVSIHGSSPSMHDSLTRARGSFVQTLKAIENLAAIRRSHALRLVTSTVLVGRNASRLRSILDLLVRFEPDAMVLNVVEPSGEALGRYGRLQPGYAEMARVIEAALHGFWGRGRVLVEGLPLCLCRGFLDCTGIREEIHLLEGREVRILSPGRNQIHGEPCRECARAEACPGVFESYARLRGWEEITPFQRGMTR